jgi:hypothetical protein
MQQLPLKICLQGGGSHTTTAPKNRLLGGSPNATTPRNAFPGTVKCATLQMLYLYRQWHCSDFSNRL